MDRRLGQGFNSNQMNLSNLDVSVSKVWTNFPLF